MIAQLAHTLAGHVTWTGLRDFVVVFGLVWIAWLEGFLRHARHGVTITDRVQTNSQCELAATGSSSAQP